MVDPHVTMGLNTLNTNGQMAWMIFGSPIFGNPILLGFASRGPPKKVNPIPLIDSPNRGCSTGKISKITAQELIAEW